MTPAVFTRGGIVTWMLTATGGFLMQASPSSSAETERSDDISRAIDRLKSFHDGDQGVNDIVRLGPKAIPAIRDVLLEREPSGLFHARVRAVDALAALGAYGILADFLRLRRPIDDPVERLGEDVVIDAAARGIARSRQQWAFDLLLELAKRPHFTSGVICALGSFRRPESIPILIAALGEDEARLSAEGALKAVGRLALPNLINAANLRQPSTTTESESNLRRRRSALYLLTGIGLPKRLWPRIRGLMKEEDTKIALLACRLCINSAANSERQNAIDRLQQLRRQADWSEQTQIDRVLSDCGIHVGDDQSCPRN